MKTLAGSPVSDENSPVTSSPQEGPGTVFDMEGFAGLSGYVVFTGGTSPDCDIELWCKDNEQNDWFLVESKSTVGERQEVRFKDQARWRKCFLRVLNVT